MYEKAGLSALERLIGQDISGVYFVRDYVQLVFDRHTLTCYTLPMIRPSDLTELTRAGAPGYKDTLCRFIDRHVQSVVEKPRAELWIQVEGGEALVISLRAEDAVGPEIALLHETDGAGGMVVWQCE